MGHEASREGHGCSRHEVALGDTQWQLLSERALVSVDADRLDYMLPIFRAHHHAILAEVTKGPRVVQTFPRRWRRSHDGRSPFRALDFKHRPTLGAGLSLGYVEELDISLHG